MLAEDLKPNTSYVCGFVGVTGRAGVFYIGRTGNEITESVGIYEHPGMVLLLEADGEWSAWYLNEILLEVTNVA